jgi:hypothetical protein
MDETLADLNGMASEHGSCGRYPLSSGSPMPPRRKV